MHWTQISQLQIQFSLTSFINIYLFIFYINILNKKISLYIHYP